MARGVIMAKLQMHVEDLIKGLNHHFSEERIKHTARAAAKIPATGRMSQLAEVLGVIPKEDLKNWRDDNARMPALIEKAMNQGIRHHLKDVAKASRSKSAKAAPKAIVFKLEHADHWELNIRQHDSHSQITLTVKM